MSLYTANVFTPDLAAALSSVAAIGKDLKLGTFYGLEDQGPNTFKFCALPYLLNPLALHKTMAAIIHRPDHWITALWTGSEVVLVDGKYNYKADAAPQLSNCDERILVCIKK